jgi:DNA repair protein RecN (Recombination protein N)
VLAELLVQDLAVWPRASFVPAPGLTVITGESGAGKSLLLEAIRLSLGERAGAGTVREGAARTVLVSRWTGVDPAVGDPAEDLIVRREIGADGRSTCRLGDEPVTLGRLRALAAGLVRGGRQGEAARFATGEATDLLDDAAGLTAERRAVAEAFAALSRIDEQMRAVSGGDPRERARRLDYLAHVVAEVAAVAPTAAEEEALSLELGRLRHAERLRRLAGGALAALSGDGGGPVETSAVDALRAAARHLAEAAALDPTAAGWAERLVAVAEEAADIGRDLGRYVDGLDSDPEREAAVLDRLGAIGELKRKYGADVAEVLSFADRCAAEKAALEAAEGEVAALAAERERALAKWRQAAAALSSARAKGAPELAGRVTERLRELDLPHAAFAIEVAPDRTAAPDPRGMDRVILKFQANPGEPLRPLAEIASGGETSRALLAVQSVLAGRQANVTWLFDEIEAGVGGRAAWAVAQALLRLARAGQVIAVSHLAPIAAVADAHVVAEKRVGADGRASAALRQVDGEERVREMARLLSGADAAALSHARAMLERGARRRSAAFAG